MKLWKFETETWTIFVYGPFNTATEARAELNRQMDGSSNDNCRVEEITTATVIVEDN